MGSSAGAHVVAVPCPLHGHTVPFMQLCQLLAKHGIRVTFVSTPRFKPAASASKGLPIHITLLEDGLPIDYRVAVSDLSTYLRHVELLHQPLQTLLEQMRADSACPPITCLLSDSHLGWVQDVANAMGLPRICFLTSSTTEFSVLFHQPLLLSQGVLPFKEGESDIIRCVPGLPPTKRTEFPSFLQVEDPLDFEFQYFMRQIARVVEADRLLVASFHDLEAQVLQILATKLNIQPIGPLFLQGFHDDVEVDPCETWLDEQPPNSVIYIAFGTLANLEEHEVHAIAGGLELSKHSFLWALREDTVSGVPNPLPPGFKGTSNGLVVTWTQQKRILKHPSVGAFLTHCGWGSTLEAICTGVPLLCWPLYGDQLLNCNLLVEQWQVGVKIAPGLANRRQSLTRDHVASAITTIMSSSTYRLNMTNLQALAKYACGLDGSSQRNFLQLVNDLHTLSQGASKTSIE